MKYKFQLKQNQKCKDRMFPALISSFGSICISYLGFEFVSDFEIRISDFSSYGFD